MAAAHARIGAVLVALAIAVAAWLAGDGGGARAAVGQTTGPLVATDPANAAVLVAQDLEPGDARAGEVTVTNAGDSSGAFALSAGDLVDAGASLSGVLELSVQDVTAGRAVYSGSLGGLGSVALGTLAQGETRRYRFTVSFPGGRPDAEDNAYQGASTSVTFVWDAAGSASTGVASTGTDAPVAAAGSRRTPRMVLSGARRQRGAHGRVTTWVRCEATCRIVVSGTTSFGSRKASLRTLRRSLIVPGRMTVQVTLPRAARVALSRGRRVTVRLRVRTTISGRVVLARRTIVVQRPR
jgi:hypothetical protein